MLYTMDYVQAATILYYSIMQYCRLLDPLLLKPRKPGFEGFLARMLSSDSFAEQALAMIDREAAKGRPKKLGSPSPNIA